ncbi:UDP-2,4-diacetamido-2,4,6-trideoxy-beta-L-altropyranose hydrolase [Winogradskyella sp. DF17]|uniref:UDP-2,4-diacetamido-2,4, 6-trideoxy-beta-L-altropyranose hydrolase n=1 Tax=Winogradskyella pelagia TaxID=2819984 RepID=A0ABS3SXL7_9FLAO|nr:UDP-2,4-diacetamido-2,4,6-trideoxy-beta-L-altropyranose hydrolase [Winogradskyella sp. DF17]MBO3115233.1 UDP-2,4-diacetamido-2,4,6-trideoxy-beta-L-altropyranose hydrolase [Winogradskyella sp. DF17]
MIDKTILFRADGNVQIGLGHLFRLFSLVEMLKSKYKFIFLTKADSTSSVIPEQYPLATIPLEFSTEEEIRWLSSRFESKNHILIADGYQFNTNYQKEVKSKGFSLVYIDDLGKERMFADIVINHSPGLKSQDYFSEPYTKFALGTEYAMLRPKFIEAAKKIRAIRPIKEVFLCFGGSDPFNFTQRFAQLLLELNQIERIHIVLGGAYKHESLKDLIKENENRISSYSNLSESSLLSVMKQCDFGIAPASTILYELCCVKMPILSGYYVDNQENIYNGFLNEGAICGVGDLKLRTDQELKKSITALLEMKDYSEFILSQSRLFDSNITNRIKDLVKELC